MIVSSFAFTAALAYGRAADMQGLAISVGAGGLLSVALIWYAVELWVGQVEFEANQLVRKSAFGSTRIPLSQVVAYRRQPHRYGQFLRLVNAEGQTLLLLDSMTTEFSIIEKWAIENLVDANGPNARR